MTSVQVLDGFTDTAIRDDQGRLHGAVVYQGDWYAWKKGRWTARVTYDHGAPQIPVDWLSPTGWVQMRSRSFYFKDDIVLPFGWTRRYDKAWAMGQGEHDVIQSEGIEGSVTKPYLSYEDGRQYYHGANCTTNGPIIIPPPPPDLWPDQWPIPTSPAAS